MPSAIAVALPIDVDPLTGLPGRATLRSEVDLVLADRLGGQRQPCLIVLDLARFKAVNDSAGYAVGDAVLCRVARRLQQGAGAGALIARISGDGFAVLLPDGDRDHRVAERLLDLVGRPYAVEGHAVAIGCSIGVAQAPNDGADAMTLLQAADLALHQAEKEGRNLLRRFEPSMQARARLRRALENDLRAALAMQQVELRQALALEQFELHYQPQVDLDTGRVTGCEALLRWRHPERGLVPPDQFIPLAEEIGLIGLLGDWVLRTACRTAASWTGPGGGVRVSVNVSPLQLRERGALADRVAAALDQAKLPPDRLEVEITESAMIADPGGALPAIHALGVGLALDDFGTGFSSLAQLGRHPFDRIKIDRSFVFDLERPQAGATGGHVAEAAWMVRAIAALGVGLGMRTVAEGVETPRQAAMVRQAGCSEIQGYLISRPVPASAVPDLLARLAIPGLIMGATA